MRTVSLSTTIGVAVGSLFISGCATKQYVRNTVAPIEEKLDATNEIAMSADNQSKGAMSKANQNAKDLGDLRNVVANIEDYKPFSQAVVHFGLNKDSLTRNDMAKLDTVATQLGGLQRYFITVEGFTDQTGSQSYNDQLSRQRANQVISYLVGAHDIPVYRIHMVGLGQRKLIDNGISPKAREESRRVEITVYTAEPLTASGAGGN
jgi:outer membrane protein OmpA-like peptidoglycan-associated protein